MNNEESSETCLTYVWKFLKYAASLSKVSKIYEKKKNFR